MTEYSLWEVQSYSAVLTALIVACMLLYRPFAGIGGEDYA